MLTYLYLSPSHEVRNIEAICMRIWSMVACLVALFMYGFISFGLSMSWLLHFLVTFSVYFGCSTEPQ